MCLNVLLQPHEDGSLFYPTIATINLGSHTLLDYYSKMDSIEDRDKVIFCIYFKVLYSLYN